MTSDEMLIKALGSIRLAADMLLASGSKSDAVGEAFHDLCDLAMEIRAHLKAHEIKDPGVFKLDSEGRFIE